MQNGQVLAQQLDLGSINLGNVALGRKLLDELMAKGAPVPREFVMVQEMLEACERNSLQVAANIADARREKSQARLKGNEALLKEQNDLFEKIAAAYNCLAATDEWTKK
ncbi:hypothetical protein SDRG_03302 [Saprolegnia diclina VS20]|uniref:Uncharacterized protein n=1 Tax=Saprolegnia diclina (strain VS20) TaxID=1156394 RepID=T0QM04_SAPDV|nr:hypothetical protein SDRG_03302 [Saprolegnia diclina VS20]EQC39094.1 hypothetical protein SDRG_03302 [Saprolegnia diclina VS20]|eukprot:XP_008607155.1 hypothetical protein SDRG_03302 [Saprolegnia diclina VS20]